MFKLKNSAPVFSLIALIALNFTVCRPTLVRADPAQPGMYRDQDVARPLNSVEVSPNDPWDDSILENRDEGSSPVWAQILLWIPNRVIDFIDIFRVDVGIGPAFGGVVRLSKQGQFGYRKIAPASVRVGLFGRQEPFMVETSSEMGAGARFQNSTDRRVCQGEVGLGADLLVSGYVGVCGEELIDFLAGIVFIDLEKDDLD